MDRQLSWSKAYIVSALLHLVLFALLALGLMAVVQQQEQQVYVIDLTTSEFEQGSGHAGGGGSESLFPEPLKAEEVAKRVETVRQTVPSPVTTTETQATTPTPDAVTLPTQGTASESAPAAASGSETGSNLGGAGSGTGVGTGSGDGEGDGRGTGEGTGTGEGSGDGDVQGKGSIPFDAEGFRLAIDAHKQYPYMATKRRLEGRTGISVTLSASGAITSVVVNSPSGHSMLDDAAVAAAYAVGSYPNPTGAAITVNTGVSFTLR